MPSQDFAIAIMAAGKGTRLKSKRPKVLHEVGGKPLVAHVIRSAAQVVSAENIYVIIGHEAESVRSAVAHTGVKFVLQAEQRGTGHAIQSAQKELGGHANFLVLSGDAPLIRPETIRRIRDFHLEQGAAMTILTAAPSDPTGYGRVLREGSTNRVAAIVEQKSLRPEQSNVGEINSGFYAFRSGPLFSNINRLETNNPHGEYYLTDMAALLVAEGQKVMAIRADDPDEVCRFWATFGDFRQFSEIPRVFLPVIAFTLQFPFETPTPQARTDPSDEPCTINPCHHRTLRSPLWRQEKGPD